MSDFEFDDVDEEALLNAATQFEAAQSREPFAPSPRPTKRQRLNNGITSTGRGTPARQSTQYMESSISAKNRQKTRMHQPQILADLTAVQASHVDNIPQSQAWDFRGPAFHKSVSNGGPVQTQQSMARPLVASASRLDLSSRAPRIGPSEDQLIDSEPPGDDDDPFEKDFAEIPSDTFDDVMIVGSASGSFQAENQSFFPPARVRAPTRNLQQTTLFGREGLPDGPQTTARRNWPLANREEPPTHHELDLNAADTWVYPTNLGTTRDYQFNIVKRGLFHNTLVALPTGLGKTFIAATVMLNWYRWAPKSQIIFVAPTKPLVAQQIGACFHIAGIPRSETTALTGDVSPAIREEQWQLKRVFFMTPQTLHQDLTKGICDPKKIVLIVVDEAHRAKGNYAFVQVVKFIRRFNESFRVLALTATPGGDVEAVQEVIDALDISRVEIRTDHSLDIQPYIYDKEVEKRSLRNSDEMERVMELYCKAVKPLMDQLGDINPTYSGDPLSLTPFGCNKALRQWMSTQGRTANPGFKGKVMAIFGVLGSVSHGMDLLKYHGIRPAYNNWLQFGEKNESSKSKNKTTFLKNEHWRKMMDMLKMWTDDRNFIGHPKLEYLCQVVMDHLLDAADGRIQSSAGSTRIMVFSSFRDSAEQISKALKMTNEMIKPSVFVGQADSKTSKGMTQKMQLETIEKFKAGEYNVLVATSIGEEGLDIGEVDLIVCYDSKASPLRMLQRMGRTGRKRSGKVVLLQMEGKEQNDWGKAMDSYTRMQKEIANGDKFRFHEDLSRRILPHNVHSEPDKRAIEIPIENTQQNPEDMLNPTRRRKTKTKKKFHMPDGVETGFITAGTLSNGRSKRSPVEDTEVIAPRAEVFLNDTDRTKFERHYVFMDFGGEDGAIPDVEMGKYPHHQRQLTTTKFVPHGKSTRAFVSAFDQISHIDRYTPAEYKITARREYLRLDAAGDPEVIAADDKELSIDPIEEPTRALGRPKAAKKATNPKPAKKRAGRPTYRRNSSAAEGDESSPPPTDPRMALVSGGISLGSDDTLPPSQPLGFVPVEVDDDSDLESFVVSDDEPIELDDGDDGLPSSSLLLKRKRRRLATKPRVLVEDDEDEDDLRLPPSPQLPNGRIRAVANQPITVDCESSDELPDLDDLVSNGPTKPTSKNQTNAAAAAGRKRRLIVESDEDSD
jgi:ATP-dependent DNA helicase MPH1